MRTIYKALAALVCMLAATTGVKAQYYQLANQATDMIQAALRGGFNYRGFVDAQYLAGIGGKQASFLEISTTQGFKYSDWFYMGVGAGVDYMMTTVNDNYYAPTGSNYKKNAVMIPMFTDFRVNVGSQSSTSLYIDLKIGAGFYVSNKYILVGDGYINSSESFLLRPSVGMRVPVSQSNPKLAVNLGVTYQLLTNSYWYNPTNSSSVTLNSLGATVSFEW